jgi:hypothetical protein
LVGILEGLALFIALQTKQIFKKMPDATWYSKFNYIVSRPYRVVMDTSIEAKQSALLKLCTKYTFYVIWYETLVFNLKFIGWKQVFYILGQIQSISLTKYKNRSLFITFTITFSKLLNCYTKFNWRIILYRSFYFV